MNRLNVAANDELAAGYHLVMLEGAALRDVAWAPGQTLRVAIGPTAINRSCTPIAWNPTAGRACIFGYARGTGPGSACGASSRVSRGAVTPDRGTPLLGARYDRARLTAAVRIGPLA